MSQNIVINSLILLTMMMINYISYISNFESQTRMKMKSHLAQLFSHCTKLRILLAKVSPEEENPCTILMITFFLSVLRRLFTLQIQNMACHQ